MSFSKRFRADKGETRRRTETPRMQNRLTLRIYTTTGTGSAKNRAFLGVISVPAASQYRRVAPAATRMKLSAISKVGTSQLALEGSLPAVGSLKIHDRFTPGNGRHAGDGSLPLGANNGKRHLQFDG